MTRRLDFVLPPELEAGEPPEARGLTRDAVRMLVAHRDGLRLEHSKFTLLAQHLDPSDVVVVNTSATLPAAFDGLDPVGGRRVEVHLSTELGAGRWAAELREHGPPGGRRWAGSTEVPRHLVLGEDGSSMDVVGPYGHGGRLWTVRFDLPCPLQSWLTVRGRPIRYGYVPQPWPLSMYQNVYATDPGSAEMPSAGRPFTPELVTRLVAKGVGLAPVVLHTGVASTEADELPYPERVVVPKATADRVNAARTAGGRVVAVGTTVVRALESAHDASCRCLRPLDGWTDLVVTPERGVRVVDGLLTGWHEPNASHLLLLEAVAGRPLLEASYAAGVAAGYLWHEFGDVHLVLP